MPAHRETIFEFTNIGSIVRVSAVDVETGLEAVIQGPATAGESTLRAAAMRKLQYLLDKQKA